MSANFTGVTFPNQKVTPANDAVVRRAVLADGILTGCDFSYSGSTLTMTAGQLIVCGRQIIHPSSQNWAIAGATSGVARLLLTIDVTRTSTKDTFDQVLDQIQYATDVNGFPELEQSDINASGTRYQVAACVVSLGPGGITGIINKLDEAEGGGAGGVLTVKATPGMLVTVSKDDKTKTKSADADGEATFRGLKRGEWNVTIREGDKTKSKTVMIETDYTVEISLFSATVSVYCPLGLMCIASDGTQSIFQTISSYGETFEIPNPGTWKFTLPSGLSSEVVISYDGQKESIRYWYLYWGGDERSDVTGGWKAIEKGNIAVTLGSDAVTIALTAGTKDQPGGLVTTSEACDLRTFGTLCASVNVTDVPNTTVSRVDIGVAAAKITSVSPAGVKTASSKSLGEQVLSVDLASVDASLGEVYPYFRAYCASAKLSAMWVEG